MRTMIQKLKSTKLWCAIAGMIIGIAIAMGGDTGTIQTVAGAVTSLVSLVTYIITEGRVDAAAVGQTVSDIQNAVDAVATIKNEKDSTNLPESDETKKTPTEVMNNSEYRDTQPVVEQ